MGKMEGFDVKSLVSVYGPLAFGWIVAVYLLLRLVSLAEKMHNCIVEYTKAITQLTVVIQERLK